jgi:hypothetical protein
MTHYNVQIAVTKPGWVGVPWKTVRAYKNQAVANRVAKNMECDGEITRVLQSDGVYITREQVKS